MVCPVPAARPMHPFAVIFATRHRSTRSNSYVVTSFSRSASSARSEAAVSCWNSKVRDADAKYTSRREKA